MYLAGSPTNRSRHPALHLARWDAEAFRSGETLGPKQDWRNDPPTAIGWHRCKLYSRAAASGDGNEDGQGDDKIDSGDDPVGELDLIRWRRWLHEANRE